MTTARAYCNGMSNFGTPYAPPCGWAGTTADATYILDERRCPQCGGALCATPPTATVGRKPTVTDFEAWVSTVYGRAAEIDGSDDIDWNDMALGFLLARGVDSGFTNWELLSSYTCGDVARMQCALDEINTMTAPTRPEVDEDDDEPTP